MDQTSVRLGVIGCGRWGINHVKTAHALLGAELLYAADADLSVREKIGTISPSIRFTSRADDIILDPNVTGVVVATPAETHFEVTKKCLENGKHVLVEKPITLHSIEARELVLMARKNDLRLMVGHVLLYHPAVIAMKQAIWDSKKIGNLQYIYSNRLNLGTIRSEENILWSFAPHDISIIQYFTDAKPVQVEAFGAQFLQKGTEDTTLTYLKYPDNVHAHIFVSWLHPFKEHRVVATGDEGMLVFEDSLKADKLKFFPKGFHKTETGFEKFEGDYEPIPFEDLQPLGEEHKHFYDCIRTGNTPLTDGIHALGVLEILEEASRKLRLGSFAA